MQNSFLLTRRNTTPNAPNLNYLSHLDILFVISANDMHTTHLNKYVKTLLNRSDLVLSLNIFKTEYIIFYTFYKYISLNIIILSLYIYIYTVYIKQIHVEF